MKHHTLAAQAALLTTAMTALLVACGGGGEPTVSAASDQRAKALAVGVQPASSLPYYYVKQIPLPAGGAAGTMAFSYMPSSMNGLGQLIGSYSDVNGTWLPFFYDGTANHRIDLPSVGEGVALNDAGVVVGYFSVVGQGYYRPFKWSLGTGFVDFVGLGLLPDGSEVWGIAENGTISGNYPSGQNSQGYPNYQGFVIRPDGRIVAPPGPGGRDFLRGGPSVRSETCLG